MGGGELELDDRGGCDVVAVLLLLLETVKVENNGLGFGFDDETESVAERVKFGDDLEEDALFGMDDDVFVTVDEEELKDATFLLKGGGDEVLVVGERLCGGCFGLLCFDDDDNDFGDETD